MYGVVREFQPPLGVTHAVRGRFGATPSAFGTVFARKNSLDTYVVRANLESARLELLASTFLGATVVSIAATRKTTTSDVLFVAFERMRIAILSWHPEVLSWVTEQLLDLGKLLGSTTCSPEGIALGMDPRCRWRPLLRGSSGSDSDPIVRADPSGHCIAVLSKTHSLFYILPIRSDDDAKDDCERFVNSSSIFVVDLPSEYEAINVKDFVFLHGMFEPHVSVLFESKRTWPGRTAVQRNTCSLLTFSIDLRTKRTSNSWGMDQLPYDCDKLEAVPDSARGGVLIISSSVIMQVRHGRCVAGLSLNCYGDSYAAEMQSKYESIVQSDTLVECDAAHCRFLDVEETTGEPSQSIALLSLKGGELYFLHIAVDSQNIITMKRAGSTVIASEIVPVNERFFILPSRLSDSLLVEYKRVEVESMDADRDAEKTHDVRSHKLSEDDTNVKRRTKRKKRKQTIEEEDEYEMIYGVKEPEGSSEEESDDISEGKERTLDLNENDDQGTRGVYDDDDELGFVFKSDVVTGNDQGVGNWALTVKDTVPCFGPGADITMGPSPSDMTKTQLDIVVAGGYAKNGCLAVVQQSIRPSNFAEFSIPGCNGIWTLLDPNVLRLRERERDLRNSETLRRNEARKARNANVRESRRECLQKAIAQYKQEKRKQLMLEQSILSEPSKLAFDESRGSLLTKDFLENLSDQERIDNSSQIESITEKENALKTSQKTENLNNQIDIIETNSNSNIAALADALNFNSFTEGKQPSIIETEERLNSSNVNEDSSHMFKGEKEDNIVGTNVHTFGSSRVMCGLASKGDSISSPEKLQFDETGKAVLSAPTIVESEVGNGDLSTMKSNQLSQNVTNLNEETRQKALENQKTQSSPKEADIIYNNINDQQHSHIQEPLRKRQKSSNCYNDHDNGNEVDFADVEVDKEEMLELRHQVESSIPLEEEEDMESPVEGEEWFHSFMLLSTDHTTTVFATGLDLEEVTPGATDFVTTEKTLVAGNVFRDHAIVQVVPSKVRIIMNGKVQCDFTIGQGKPIIISAQICDPLVLLSTEDYQVTVLRVEADSCIESVQSPENRNEVYGDDEFDEYGMTVSNGPETAGNITSGSKDSKDTDLRPSFKNFRLCLDFTSTEAFGDVAISSAFLYTGPLASEVSRDGILRSDHAFRGEDKGSTVVDMSSKPGEKVKNLAIESEMFPKSFELKGEDVDDEDRMLYDDEDQLLYGVAEADYNNQSEKGVSREGEKSDEDTVNGLDPDIKKPRKNLVPQSEKGVVLLEDSPVTQGHGHLLVIAMKDGGLRVLSKELEYETILYCPFMYTGPSMVTDFVEAGNGSNKNMKPFPTARPEFGIDSVVMTEVLASCHLPGFSTPYLIFTSHSGLPVLYRAFMSTKPSARCGFRSRLTFKRIVFRDGSVRWFTRLMKKSESAILADGKKISEAPRGKRIDVVRFENIRGRSGLFFGGDCPAFLFAERGYPRIHELAFTNRTGETVSLEEYENGQGVLSFAEFHNMNCPRGFVCVGHDHVVRIGALPETAEVNYDAPTPFRKVALRCTPHKVAYHGGSATYGVLASMPTLTTREERLARILQSLEKHDKRHYQHTAAQAEAETGDERGGRVPPLFEELHELRVYRPDNWNLIRSHKLQKGEVGLAITNMKVDVYKQRLVGSGVEIPSSRKGDDGNESMFAASLKLRAKDVLVVGTGYLNGEDASSRGRLLLFEISRQEVYTEAGGAYTAFQLQLIAEKEVLSPVTAVAAMEGYVIAGVGPLVSVYKLVGDEIVHLSFAFGQLYCPSIASMKQYILAADMCKSVSFMYFRERNNSVNFLARDYEMVTSYATEFLIENGNMSIIISDGMGNIRLLNYVHASVAASRGGKRLLLNGGIHIGSRVNKFVRVRAPDKKKSLSSNKTEYHAGHQALMFATLDGGLGALVAVTEDEFRKLKKAWNVIKDYDGLMQCGGINVEDVCALRHSGSAIELLEQRLLDSRLIYEVFGMTMVEMSAIGRQSGMKIYEFIEKLLALDTILWRF